MLKQAGKISNPAGKLIAQEAAKLMAEDAAKYPIPGLHLKGKPSALPTISDNDLADARLLILSETKKLPNFEDIQLMFESRAENSTLLGLGCYSDDETKKEAAIRAAFGVSFGCPRMLNCKY